MRGSFKLPTKGCWSSHHPQQCSGKAPTHLDDVRKVHQGLGAAAGGRVGLVEAALLDRLAQCAGVAEFWGAGIGGRGWCWSAGRESKIFLLEVVSTGVKKQGSKVGGGGARGPPCVKAAKASPITIRL